MHLKKTAKKLHFGIFLDHSKMKVSTNITNILLSISLIILLQSTNFAKAVRSFESAIGQKDATVECPQRHFVSDMKIVKRKTQIGWPQRRDKKEKYLDYGINLLCRPHKNKDDVGRFYIWAEKMFSNYSS